MASHFQEDFIANKGDDMGPIGTTNVQPKGVDASQAHHSSGNELGDSEMVDRANVGGNPVLESDAQTKGSWFAYLKTKQFWVALLLGQGVYSILSSFHVAVDKETRTTWILTPAC
jgi:solute carrier family 35 protein F1/2